ncbi:MAG TPA: hypothetical protein VM802_21645 [Chitinophaga sp.]|nr:hypothetical protein [Chitinophaga sp.]HVI47491.1 hypothetical protein [Chitinophaga sp.]
MKIICLLLITVVLIVALVATYLIRKEQQNNIGNKFLQLIKKFDSWQMLR